LETKSKDVLEQFCIKHWNGEIIWRTLLRGVNFTWNIRLSTFIFSRKTSDLRDFRFLRRCGFKSHPSKLWHNSMLW